MTYLTYLQTDSLTDHLQTQENHWPCPSFLTAESLPSEDYDIREILYSLKPFCPQHGAEKKMFHDFFLRIWPYDDTSRIILNLQSCLDCCWFTLFLYHLVLMSWEGRIGLISLGKGEPKCAWAPHQSLPCAKHTRWTESHSRKQSACCHCHHCNSILLFSPASNCRLPCHSVLQSV